MVGSSLFVFRFSVFVCSCECACWCHPFGLLLCTYVCTSSLAGKKTRNFVDCGQLASVSVGCSSESGSGVDMLAFVSTRSRGPPDQSAAIGNRGHALGYCPPATPTDIFPFRRSTLHCYTLVIEATGLNVRVLWGFSLLYGVFYCCRGVFVGRAGEIVFCLERSISLFFSDRKKQN